jgi:hypothetical protein
MKSFLALLLCLASLADAQVVKGGTSNLGGTAELNSSTPIAVSIVVTPANTSQQVNTSLGYTAIANLSNGLTTSVTKLSTWTTSNSAIASVGTLTNTQAINCVSPGTVQVQAAFGALSASTTLTCAANPPPPPPVLVSISVTPSNPTLNTFTGIGFIATGTFADGSIKDVTTTATWASSSPSVASLGTLTTQQVANCLTAGVSTISATLGTILGSTVLTCTTPPATLVSIVVTPALPSIDVGQSIGMIATGTFSDGSTRDITTTVVWASSNSAVASIAAAAAPQPVNCLAAGTSTISATSGAINNHTTLTCVAALSSITVTPGSPTITVGTSQAFVATGTFTDGTQKNVSSQSTWTSSNTAVATISGSASTSQSVTCAAAGTSLIKATVGSVNGSTTLTCSNPAPPPTLSSIVVTPANPSSNVGSALGFIATGTYSDGSQQNVTQTATWLSATPAHATLGALTTTQSVNCIAGGTSVISATIATISGNTTLTCVVPAPTLVSIAVTPALPSINIGGSIGFIATGTYSDGSTQDVTVASTWNSASTSVATLGARTTQQSVNCVTAGTSVIKATLGAVNGSTTLTCLVPIPTLQSITITPANPSVTLPGGVGFIATGTYSDGSTRDVTLASTWLSSNPSVATIGAAGDPQPTTCVAAGSTTISATSSSVVGHTTLTCNNPPPPPPTLVSIAVTPNNPSVSVGTTLGFTATGTFSDGSTQNLTATATWGTGTPTVATLTSLTATENVTCLRGGTSAISAAVGAINNNTTLTCNAVLTSITVTPASPQTNVGTAQNFIATGHYNDGSVADVTLQSTWASSNTLVATITAKADPQPANCILAGTSTISATVGSVSGNTTLTCLAVGPPPPTLSSITVTPASPTVNVGSTVGFLATCNYSDGSTKDCTISQNSVNTIWTSGTPAHATLASPVVDPEVATCIAAGTSVIIAANGATSGNTTLTCQTPAPTLVSIAVTPTNPNQFVGSNVGFTATGTYSDSTTKDVTLSSTWTSSATSVATVASPVVSPETATCLTAGASTIKAAVGAVNGTTSLGCQSVTPPNFGVDGYCGPGNVPSFGASDAYALLPQTCYYTNPSARPTTGSVRLATAATWTSVWGLTACDDVVEIAAGTTLSGSFVIPSLVCPVGHYRTLRVQNFASTFPAYGTIRAVSPCYWGVASLPGYPAFNCSSTTNRGATIQSTGTGIPITLTSPTSGLQIEGIKITRTAGTGYIARMIKVEAPNFSRIIFDSDWVAGTPLDDTQRVLIMDGISFFAFINGLATDLHCTSGGPCSANQAFSGGFSTLSTTQDHTWKIVNNYITSADNTTIGLGGGRANTTPADIEFRLNWGQKLQIWNPSSPTYSTAPKMFVVKQSLESKNSDRFFVEGNVFDGVWAGFSQIGSHILFTPKNQAISGVSVCANCSVTNWTVRYNFFTTSNNCFQIANAAGDAGGYATAGNSYSIHDNVCENTNYATCYKCGTNSGAALDGGVIMGTASTVPTSFILQRIFVNHNDYIPAAGAFTMGGTLGISGPLASSGKQMTNYTWTNNVILKEPLNNPGSNPINNPSDGCSANPVSNCYCGNGATPVTVLNACFGSYQFGGNAIVNGAGKTWPGANCVAETQLANIFVNYNGGFNGPNGVSNYLLKTTSTCHNSALDGTDPGANIPVLANRIQGVATFH